MRNNLSASNEVTVDVRVCNRSNEVLEVVVDSCKADSKCECDDWSEVCRALSEVRDSN